MRRVAYVGLFFLAGILMPVLIWVALFVAIRQPLLRAMRRVGYAMLFFLVGILMPVLIWVALVVVIREPLLRAIGRLALAWRQVATTRRAIRPVAYASLLFLVAILMPVLIWVAFAVVARELWLRWRESRLPSTLITANPPPRFVWVEGRYVPQY